MTLLWYLLFAAAASLVVKVYPERVLASQGGPVTLRCQVSGSPPHYFHWSREDGRPISPSADRRRQGTEHVSTTWQQQDMIISFRSDIFTIRDHIQRYERLCVFPVCVCAGAELYFPTVQPSDAGVYVCACRDKYNTNRSRAEIVVTSAY